MVEARSHCAHTEWTDIPFVLRRLLPTQGQRKTLLQQSKISHSSKTCTANRFPSPVGKEEEHWIVTLWFLTLGCKIHLPFFRLPSPSQVLSFSVLAPSSLSPSPAPLALCVRVLLRATADDSHLK